MYSNSLVHLEHWREDFSLSSVTTVVKVNTYIRIWLAYLCGACLVHLVRDVWLTVNLTCACDEFAHVVHF